MKSVIVSLCDIYERVFLAACLGVAAVAPLPGVDYSAYLDTESRSPDAHRGSLHHAYVRVSAGRPVTGTQQTS